MNTTTATRNVRRRPTRSASRPAGMSSAAKTIVYAFRTHDSDDGADVEKSARIDGKGDEQDRRVEEHREHRQARGDEHHPWAAGDGRLAHLSPPFGAAMAGAKVVTVVTVVTVIAGSASVVGPVQVSSELEPSEFRT